MFPWLMPLSMLFVLNNPLEKEKGETPKIRISCKSSFISVIQINSLSKKGTKAVTGAVPFQKVHFCTQRLHIGTLVVHISTQNVHINT